MNKKTTLKVIKRGEIMQYTVTLHYTTLASVEVSAESEEEAITKALEETTIEEIKGQLLSNMHPWFQTSDSQ